MVRVYLRVFYGMVGFRFFMVQSCLRFGLACLAYGFLGFRVFLRLEVLCGKGIS